METKKGMTLIVRTVTGWLKGFIFLYGVYIVFTGHLSPGGGFAGGVIIACTFVLVTLACGKEVALGKMGKLLASELDSLGAILFAVVALLGYTGGVFFRNFIQMNHPAPPFRIFSAGTILLSNIGIGMKVGASLFMVFIILAVLRVIPDKEGKMKMVQKKEVEEED